ncbi:hypothetical protein H4219_002960 [Mycoemilia scoparia]|uniref:Uncharacterized protein n=1 Tax=Mycoemilia scoparia TaxID=417184 RepID=A0A9W8DU25_9FUNG|nr:hypothetical protein H4219_002960 [Mycoemilia scoparia]
MLASSTYTSLITMNPTGFRSFLRKAPVETWPFFFIVGGMCSYGAIIGLKKFQDPNYRRHPSHWDK